MTLKCQSCGGDVPETDCRTCLFRIRAYKCPSCGVIVPNPNYLHD